MPSPFPGMDPFLEGQKWKGFHHSLISVIRDALMPLVRPRYVVDVEEKVFLATNRGEPLRFVTPDVAVISRTVGWSTLMASWQLMSSPACSLCQ